MHEKPNRSQRNIKQRFVFRFDVCVRICFLEMVLNICKATLFLVHVFVYNINRSHHITNICVKKSFSLQEMKGSHSKTEIYLNAFRFNFGKVSKWMHLNTVIVVHIHGGLLNRSKWIFPFKNCLCQKTQKYPFIFGEWYKIFFER